MKKLLLLLLTSSIACWSCSSDEICLESVEANVNIGFYHKINGVEADTSLMGFSVRGLGRKDSLYKMVDNISKFAIPLSQNDDQTSFILLFSILDTTWFDTISQQDVFIYYSLADTLQFNYQRTLNLVSEECGFTHYFQIDQILNSQNVIQSITITEPEISTLDGENIKILF